jgi:hypothetical protein
MYKVLIYSSQALYDSSGYEGRAEADLIAVKDEKNKYRVLKSRIPFIYANLGTYRYSELKHSIEQAENKL